MKKIVTAYQSREARMAADAMREYRSTRKQLLSKIDRWEKRYAHFGGKIQLDTLNKFRNMLDVLEGRTSAQTSQDAEYGDEAAMFNEWVSNMDAVYAPFKVYDDFKNSAGLT